MLTPHIKKEKPPFPYDRPLSWSQISSFKYRPSQWYASYVLGIRGSSPEMTFGSMVDKRIQDEPDYLPKITRLTHLQYKLEVELNGVNLIGLPDALDLENPHLIDYKTGRNKWDKKRANETGQLTMYLLMIYIKHKIEPEKFRCAIQWMPTHIKDGEVAFVEEGEVITIETKRTMKDILEFGQEIVKVRQQMLDYYNRQ